MAEVRALRPNGLSVVGTFSGAGGSSLGYRMAGFRVLWASEFVAAARETYAANFPDVVLDDRDIRAVRPEEILERAGLREGELDLLDGSPPCASFSTAGNRQRDWGTVKKYSDRKQRTDDLFFEFVRILRGLKPRAFVAENVSGLVKGVGKGYFKEILREFQASGYRVRARLLDAQWLGVPQGRQRLIFVGFREDLGVDPAHPEPLPFRYSIRDACPWITGLRAKGHGGEHDVDRPAPTLPASAGGAAFSGHAVERDAKIEKYAIGREWAKLRPGEGSEKYLNLVRTHEDKPCPTVSAVGGAPGAASVTHPTERRKFTIAELRRLCSFPDDFVLTGSFAQQWERMGRAVPPLMMRAVARVVRDQLLALDGRTYSEA